MTEHLPKPHVVAHSTRTLWTLAYRRWRENIVLWIAKQPRPEDGPARKRWRRPKPKRF